MKFYSGEDIIPFGKYKGTKVKYLPDDYYEWLNSRPNIRLDRTIGVEYSKDFTPQEEYSLNQKIQEEVNKIMVRTNLEEWEARLALKARNSRVTKRGNPTIDDWDDEVEYEKPKEFYGQHFNYYNSNKRSI